LQFYDLAEVVTVCDFFFGGGILHPGDRKRGCKYNIKGFSLGKNGPLLPYLDDGGLACC